MEYFTTYLWVVLIVAVVFAVFFSMGVFNSNSVGVSGCLLPAGFLCASYRLSASGVLTANIRQAASPQITVTAIGCSNNAMVANMRPPYNPPSNQVTVPNGGNYTFNVQCYSNGAAYSGQVGSSFGGYVFINYTDSNGAKHTVQGKILAIVSQPPTTSTVTTTTSTSTTSTSTTSTSTTSTSTTSTTSTSTVSTAFYCVGGETSSAYINSTYIGPVLASGDVSSWLASNAYPQNVALHSCASASNVVYCVGGVAASGARYNAVYYAPILDTGALGAWAATNAYPIAIYGQSCAATQDYVYCIAGNSGGANINSVYYAPVLPGNAGLGSWILTNSYLAKLEYAGCVFSSGDMYCAGGYGSAVSSTAYYAPVLPSGALGTWAGTNSYPLGIYGHGCAANSNAMYCVGGYSSDYTGLAYYAPVLPGNAGLGTWTATASYPLVAFHSACSATQSAIYCVAGNNGGSTYYNAVYYAQIAPGGALGTWTASNSYGGKFTGLSCVSTPTTSTTTTSTSTTFSTAAYCIGGETSFGYTNAVYVGPTVAGGAINPWVASNSYPANDYYQSCASASGAVYCVGGIMGSNSNAVYYASILPDNLLSTWSSQVAYPFNVERNSCVATQLAVYCVGGLNTLGYYFNTVYYAPILSGGVLGAWTPTSSYPLRSYDQKCTFSSGYVYCLGGHGPGSSYNVNTVYYASVLPGSNALGTWTATNTYPFGNVVSQSCASTSSAVYCVGGYNASTRFNAVYYASILPGGAGLGTWTAASTYPQNSGDLSCISYPDSVYCVGGYTGSAYTNTVYYAPILGGGALGTWTAVNAYPFTWVIDQSCVSAPTTTTTTTTTVGLALYCAGGWVGGDGYLKPTYYAPVLSDGSLGQWQPGIAYPTHNVIYDVCVSNSNTVYCIGGMDGSSIANNVYYAPILASNILGSWTATNAYLAPVDEHSCVVSSSGIYCVGGEVSGGSLNSVVYFAPILSDGALGKWTTANTHAYSTANVMGESCVTDQSKVYCIGGTVKNGQPAYSNAVYYASFGSANSLGAWTATNAYPYNITASDCALHSGVVYCVGGSITSGRIGLVYYAPVLSGGGLGSWTPTNSYPTVINDQNCEVASSRLYCVAGYSTSWTNSVYYAPILSSGLGSWVYTSPYPYNVIDFSCTTPPS